MTSDDHAYPIAGDMLAHYKVLERLASGGMGEIYVAEDTELSDKIRAAARPVLDGKAPEGRIPEFWDGKTAGRIVDVFEAWWRDR